MPGKTAKVTITERQHDILRTIQTPPWRRPSSGKGPRSSSRPLTARASPDRRPVGLSRRQVSPWRRRWADAWTGSSHQGSESHAAGPSSKSSAMEPWSGPPVVHPEQIVQIWPWPASPRRSRSTDHSLDGRRRPMRSWSAASCRRSRWPRWDVISTRPPCSPTRSGIGSNHREAIRCNFRSRSSGLSHLPSGARVGVEPPDPHGEQRRDDGHRGVGAKRPESADDLGQGEKLEFEYEGHGTLTLIGNFEVTTGELIAPTIGPTWTEADSASHIEQTVATDPTACVDSRSG